MRENGAADGGEDSCQCGEIEAVSTDGDGLADDAGKCGDSGRRERQEEFDCPKARYNLAVLFRFGPVEFLNLIIDSLLAILLRR